MKKLLAIFLLFVSTSVFSVEIDEGDEELIAPRTYEEDQYEWQKISEADWYETSQPLAVIAGAFLGAKAGATASPSILGAIAGGTLGWYGAQGAVAAGLAKAYGVSRRVALAAYISGETLNNPEMKRLFIQAEKGNKRYLKRYLSKYYEQRFGEDWKALVRDLVSNKGEAIEKYVAAQLPESAGIEQDEKATLSTRFKSSIAAATAKWDTFKRRRALSNEFDKSLALTYALSILYFDDTFMHLQSARLKAHKLFNALFGERD